jgi:hypothetical protein
MKLLERLSGMGQRMSELTMLSRDPALTFRPDPAFRAKLRNPDEIIDGDFDGLHSLARALTPSRQTWAGIASWRRSLKISNPAQELGHGRNSDNIRKK